MRDLYWLTEEQMARMRPYSPKCHGNPRVDDRRVLICIVFVNRDGLRWRDSPSDYGPHKPVLSLSKGRSTIAVNDGEMGVLFRWWGLGLR